MAKLTWDEKKLNDREIRDKIQLILGKDEIPGMDYLVSYYKTLYYEEKLIARLPDPQTCQNPLEQSKMRTYLESNMAYVRQICNYRLQEHYPEYDKNFIAVPDGIDYKMFQKDFLNLKNALLMHFQLMT